MMEKRTKVVCLCGPMFLMPEMRRVQHELSVYGHVVLVPFGMTPEEDAVLCKERDSRFRSTLYQAHLRRIDMADDVIVFGEDGTTDTQTGAQMAYAKKHEKVVELLNRHASDSFLATYVVVPEPPPVAERPAKGDIPLSLRHALDRHPLPEDIDVIEMNDRARLAYDTACSEFDDRKIAISSAACTAVAFVLDAQRHAANPHSSQPADQWRCPCGKWLNIDDPKWGPMGLPGGIYSYDQWMHQCAPGYPPRKAVFVTVQAPVSQVAATGWDGWRVSRDVRERDNRVLGMGFLLSITANLTRDRWLWTLRRTGVVVDQGSSPTDAEARVAVENAWRQAIARDG